MEISRVFARIAQRSASEAGRPWAFIAALSVVIVWAVSGPIFAYSDTWQLVINTGTTVVTFLMVFLIQNAQNRDTQAIQLKLDELIRATEGAHNRLMALENQSEETLQQVKEELATACEEPILAVAVPPQER
ncbi:low affinity iron permease family protein [Roseococcus sp. XZZS9]|uniref:Low affinity iron permease family protein n=2 Tax=Roseococcus pinisoli TaxID=2835040 RepID=A0ABS5QDZ6_9PROT|nr:low affinity iron permease family protein [uncultured Roseococcus sp.]MBS7811693.1 low affinity iron permease family protein [Roseococcus pinisoli]